MHYLTSTCTHTFICVRVNKYVRVSPAYRSIYIWKESSQHEREDREQGGDHQVTCWWLWGADAAAVLLVVLELMSMDLSFR